MFPFYLLCPFCFFLRFFLFWTQFSLPLAMAFMKYLSPPLHPPLTLARANLLPSPSPLPLFSLVLLDSFSSQLNFPGLSFSPFLTWSDGSFLPILLTTRRYYWKHKSFHFKCLNAAWPRASHSHSCRDPLRHSVPGTEHPLWHRASPVAFLGTQVSISGAEKFKMLSEHKNLWKFSLLGSFQSLLNIYI